jgi:hypothetical protein
LWTVRQEEHKRDNAKISGGISCCKAVFEVLRELCRGMLHREIIIVQNNVMIT